MCSAEAARCHHKTQRSAALTPASAAVRSTHSRSGPSSASSRPIAPATTPPKNAAGSLGGECLRRGGWGECVAALSAGWRQKAAVEARCCGGSLQRCSPCSARAPAAQRAGSGRRQCRAAAARRSAAPVGVDGQRAACSAWERAPLHSRSARRQPSARICCHCTAPYVPPACSWGPAALLRLLWADRRCECLDRRVAGS